MTERRKGGNSWRKGKREGETSFTKRVKEYVTREVSKTERDRERAERGG